jgi:hypothetical protein
VTLAKPKEHALSKKLRDVCRRNHMDPNAEAQLRHLAMTLDQTISVMGIWKDPARIEMTAAYSAAKKALAEYERQHPRV